VVQGRDTWQAVVNMVMKFQVLQNRDTSGLPEELLTSQGRIYSSQAVKPLVCSWLLAS
jgi:hypothetical protein